MGLKKHPRISANKLGEYIRSKPYRRRTIVKDQKYPSKFIVSRYNAAKRTIIDYFVNGMGNKKEIKSKIKTLILRTYSSPFRKQDNDLSIKALEIFANSDLPNLNSFSSLKLGNELNKLLIKGVEVSVQPNILIRGKVRGVEFIGAIKIHISKSHPLEKESGKYVATLVHKYLEEDYEEKVRPEFCIAMDIFTGEYFTAPKSFISMRKDIEAACNEIRLLWDDL